jgi:Zn/Cd-binding protein ZinT
MEKYQGIISSITEAFSMQPSTLYVGGYAGEIQIAKIVQEDVHIEGDPFAYYVGYDENGNRLFEYKKGTVNVHYQ